MLMTAVAAGWAISASGSDSTPTFSRPSKVESIPNGNNTDILTAMAPAIGGGALVLGEREVRIAGKKTRVPAVAKFDRSGRRSNFGVSGTAVVSWRSGHDLLPRAVVSIPGGRVVVLALANRTDNDDDDLVDYRPALIRLLRSGQPDPSFGNGGIRFPAKSLRGDIEANGLKVRPNGKFVFLANRTDDSVALVQTSPEGVLDKSFRGGVVSTGLKVGAPVGSVLTSAGNVIAAANSRQQVDSFVQAKCTLASVLEDGRIDSTFGASGTLVYGTPETDSKSCVAPLKLSGSLFSAAGTAGQDLNDPSSPSQVFVQRLGGSGSGLPSWNNGRAAMSGSSKSLTVTSGSQCNVGKGAVALVGVGGTATSSVVFGADGTNLPKAASRLASVSKILGDGDVHQCTTSGDRLFIARSFSLSRRAMQVQSAAFSR